MYLTWIDYLNARFKDWLDLRRRVLREPLGLDFTEEDSVEDRRNQHLLAISSNQVVGGLMIYVSNQEPDTWKIRQVAVEPEEQGKGIGTQLMERAESEARLERIKKLTLHARAEAVAYYEKFGFESEGDPFPELGIEHQAMVKILS